MEISKEELLRRLKSKSNLSNILNPPIDDIASNLPPDSIEIKSPEKREYIKGVPLEQRILAGILGRQESSVSVAKELGMTRNQVFHAARTTQTKIAGPRDATLGKVQELALEKTMTALNLMTPDKFEGESLKNLSLIASNMSKIIDRTSEKTEETRIQLVIHAPESKKEIDYKVIDV